MKYEDEVIPFSTGFCCPCSNDQHEQNMEEKDFLSNYTTSRNLRAINAYNIDIPGYNKQNYDRYEFTGKVGKVKGNPMAINIPNTAADNGDNSGSFQSEDDHRLIPFSGKY